jgi:hypothetical protein
MYATSQRMNVYFIDFFFMQSLLSFVINANLFTATNEILVINVTWNLKTSRNNQS